jgi:hypothetical protein
MVATRCALIQIKTIPLVIGLLKFCMLPSSLPQQPRRLRPGAHASRSVISEAFSIGSILPVQRILSDIQVAPVAGASLVLARPRPPEQHDLAIQNLPCDASAISSFIFGGTFGSEADVASIAPYMRLVSQTELPPDCDENQILEVFCEDGGRLANLRTRCEQVGINKRNLPEHMALVASSINFVDRALRFLLEQSIVEAARADPVKRHLLYYLETQAYDETSLMTRIKDIMYVTVAPPIADYVVASVGPADDAVAIALQPLARKVAVSLGHSSTASKMFQIHHGFAMVLRTDTENGVRYRAFIGAGIPTLRHLQRNSSPGMKHALVESTFVTSCAAQFANKSRDAMTDKFGANMVAERGIMQDRGSDWSASQRNCQVHVLATSQTRTFMLVQEFISGCLNISLSIVVAGNLGTWRKSICDDVEHRLKLFVGLPPESAVAFKHYVMGLFMARGSDIERRKILLSMLPNGEWRNRDHIEMYMLPDCHGRIPSREAMVPIMQVGIVQALAPHNLPLYPMHRWRGADLSQDELGMLSSVSGILENSYPRFCVLLGDAPRPASGATMYAGGMPMLGDDAARRVPALADGAVEGGGDGEETADLGGGRPLLEQPNLDAASAAKPGGEDDSDHKKKNAQYRRKGSLCVEHDPLGLLMATRTIIEPFRIYVDQLLALGSEKWELDERRKEVKALESQTDHNRSFPITVAASGELEDAFLDRICKLLGPEPWRFLPTRNMNVRFRHTLFRLLSRAACCVAELLRHPNTLYPTRLYLLLLDPSLWEDILEDDACTMDQRSLELREKYRSSLEDLLMILRVDAHMLQVHTASVENLWAWLRRIFESLGIQTHRLDFERARSEWMLNRARKRNTSVAKRRSAAGGANKPAPMPRRRKRGKPSKDKTRTPKTVGSWRAFVSASVKFTKGRCDFKLLAAKYKLLSEVDKARFTSMGLAEVVTAANQKSRRSAFGMRTRIAHRNIEKKRRLTEVSALAIVGNQPLMGAHAIDPSTSADSVVKAIATAKAVKYQQGLLKRADDRAAEDDIRRFNATRGAEMMSGLESDLGLALAPEHFVPVPDAKLEIFEFAPNVALLGAKCAKTIDDCKVDERRELRAALLSSSRRESQQILHEAVPPIVFDEAAEKIRKKSELCAKAGWCLCSLRGKLVAQMEKAYLNAIRAPFGRNGLHKDLMTNGSVVVCFENRRVRDDSCAALPRELEEASETHVCWFHIGLHYMSPVRSTFYELREDTGFRPDAEVEARPIPLKVSGSQRTFFQYVCCVCFFIWAAFSPHEALHPTTFDCFP